MGAPGAHAPHLHLSGWYQHDAPVARWLDTFLDSWLAGARVKAALTRAA